MADKLEANMPDRTAIRKKLFEKQDKKYREFHRKLVPGEYNFIGVRVPDIRNIAREIVKDSVGYLDTVLEEADDFYEETMVQAIAIGMLDRPPGEMLDYIRRFVPKIDNWAVCDSFCAGLKFAKKHREDVWEFLLPYLNSDDEYKIRFAVIMMLDHFIDDDYFDRVIAEIDEIDNDAYYVKMGVAWALSMCFVKYPEKTMKYFRSNDLDDFTYNKALQKTIESRQVDSKTKDRLRKMKRK